MNRLRRWPVRAVAGLVCVMALAPAAVAGETDPTVTMTVDVGVNTYVDPAAAVPVRVELSSQVLLVGRIDVTSGGITIPHVVELPAGGVKLYELTGAPIGERRSVSVSLFDTSGADAVLVEKVDVRARVPDRQILIGMIGGADLATTIRSATTEPLEFDVEVLSLDVDALTSGIDVLDYLVVADGELIATPGAVESVTAWVDDGGRLIGEPTAVAAVHDPAAGATWPTTNAVVDGVGRGEVAAVGSLAALTVEDWSALLRPQQTPGLIRDQTFFEGQGGLTAAASLGREASVPGLSWLLGGILAFVVLVGPVNFLVLRSYGRPEWAWFTVPALSFLALAVFWIAGRSAISDVSVTHAAVSVEDGRQTERRTGFVVQVADGGERRFGLPEGWAAQPAEGFGLTQGTIGSDGAIVFDLEDLGVGATSAVDRSESAGGITVTVSADSAATVTNSTDFTFWSWGVVVAGQGFTDSGIDLAPGTSATVEIDARGSSQRFESAIFTTAQRRRFSDDFDSTDFEVTRSLAIQAERMDPDLAKGVPYFFGFTDDAVVDVSLDGRGVTATGTTLHVVHFTLPDAFTSSIVRPELVAADGASSIEGYYDELYAFGAELLLLRYDVGQPIGVAAIDPRDRVFGVAEIWDWSAREYVDYTWGEPFELRRFASPTGEVMVKASVSPEIEFPGEVVELNRYRLVRQSA